VDVGGGHCKFPLLIFLPWLRDPGILSLKMPEPQPGQGESRLFLYLSTGANWDAYPCDFFGFSHTILARVRYLWSVLKATFLGEIRRLNRAH